MQTQIEINGLESELYSLEQGRQTEESIKQIIRIKENIRMLKKIALIPSPKKPPCLDYYEGSVNRMRNKAR
jgi:hypothetical protein